VLGAWDLVLPPPQRRTGLNCARFWPVSDGQSSHMPTYDYHCQKCGKNFEAFQSMRDEPFQKCPKELCQMAKWGHGKVKRLLGTGAGLMFKGSGFYSTDYRSASYKEAAKKESGNSSASGGEKGSSGKEGGAPAKESPKTAEGGKSKSESAP